MHHRDPKKQGRDPKKQGRNPEKQGRDPEKQGRDPEILGAEGKNLPREGKKSGRKRELFLFLRLGNGFYNGVFGMGFIHQPAFAARLVNEDKDLKNIYLSLSILKYDDNPVLLLDI
jgi:hypothetical protein